LKDWTQANNKGKHGGLVGNSARANTNDQVSTITTQVLLSAQVQ